MLNQMLNQQVLQVAAAFDKCCFSPSKGNILPSVLKAIQPNGSTALRDSVLEGCMLILKLFQLIKPTRFADQFNFVMIVLTDGIDQCSKCSMEQTIAVLNQIRDKIPSQILKIFFIGVDIDDQTEWEIRTLSDAAGKNAEYLNISTDQLSGVFQKLTLKLGLQKRHQIIQARNSLGQAQLSLNENYQPYLHLAQNYYTVLFNLDMSGSMNGQKWAKLCLGTDYFINCLGEQDFIGAIVFNHQALLLHINGDKAPQQQLKVQNQGYYQNNNGNYANNQGNIYNAGYNNNMLYVNPPPPVHNNYPIPNNNVYNNPNNNYNRGYENPQLSNNPYPNNYPYNNYGYNNNPGYNNVPPPVIPPKPQIQNTFGVINSNQRVQAPLLPFYRQRRGRVGIIITIIIVIALVAIIVPVSKSN